MTSSLSSSEHSHVTKSLGSAATGLVEACLFHGVDTISKRLMVDKTKGILSDFIHSRNLYQFKNSLWPIIFLDTHNKNFFSKISSLHPRMQYVVTYKILERGMGLGLQPVISVYYHKNFGNVAKHYFGDKNSKIILEAGAGTTVGMTQVILAPFDALRTKSQTNLASIHKKSVWGIIKSERFNLFNGASIIAMRNGVGSLCLFGIPQFMYYRAFNLETNQAPSFAQRFAAASTAALITSIVTNPFDVIKNRVQSVPNAKPLSVFYNTLTTEGIRAGFKGLGPKACSAVPKMSFAFTVAPYMTNAGVSLYQTMTNTFFSGKKNDVTQSQSSGAKPKP